MNLRHAMNHSERINPAGTPNREWDAGKSRCYIHHRLEAFDEHTWRVCFECGHVYQTPDALVDLELYEYGSMYANRPEPKADEIWSCPLCLHDFL